MSGEFCDTNVFVYAYDSSAGQKHERAKELVARLWRSRQGVVSVQVLQELFVALTRKLSQPLPRANARAIVADVARWRVIAPDAPDVLDAVDGSLRWQVSFWDALVVTTAAKAGVTVVWSEDLNDGQVYGAVVVRNPFAATTET